MKSKIKKSKWYGALSRGYDSFKKSKFVVTVNKVWNNAFFGKTLVRIGFLAVILNIIIEGFNRASASKAFVHLFTNPLVFFYNALMIFFTLTFITFFKRRIFVGAIISAFWLVLGTTNYMISESRVTPFTAQDFRNISDGLDLVDQYFSTFGIVFVLAIIIIVVLLLVLLAVKSPKYKGKRNVFQSILISAAGFGFLMLYLNIANATGLLPVNISNLRNAYRDYGFGYCFTSSVFNTGINKPKDYNQDKVNEIASGVDEQPTEDDNIQKPQSPDAILDEDYPNIIFVQLESLFDATKVKGLEFSEDPIPNLHKLYEEYSSGYFSVPSFGAGTANTEFEVMTGMNLDHFGPGEYPYKTVLQDKVCESIGYYLKDYDFRINALHNNKGNFYQRNKVFSRLGYDTFTSLEYIENYEKTQLGNWAKDSCLTEEIMGILNDSEEKDFIYTISVQGHGEYPEDTSDLEIPIKVTNNNVTGNPNGFEYYVNQIYEMDQFVGELVETLSNYDEKVVLVFYGDHLPTFEIEDDDLENGDTLQTEYVIWNNFGMEKEDKDIEAYQLTAVLFERLGMKGGIINQYHIKYMDSEDQNQYLKDLKILEYDILYGDGYVYDGQENYTATEIKMGYKDITITDVNLCEDLKEDTDEEDDEKPAEYVEITGTNFTRSSKVLVNGESYPTEFISNTTLKVEGVELSNGDEIVVEQRTSGGTTLSSTDIFIYEESMENKE